jgi:hypothetical protein
MIPAHHPYVARYAHKATAPNGKLRTHYTTKPVIAWDDDGHALVAGDRTLVRADSWTNFADLCEGTAKVIAAFPGGDWKAEFRNDDGSVFSCPITAWVVKDDGDCTPLHADGEGWCDNPSEAGNFVRLYHPDDESAPTAPLDPALLAEAEALRHEELSRWADDDDRYEERQRIVTHVLGVPHT